MLKHFERNASGRDFIVGDVHGSFAKLRAALDAIGFDSEHDRLFCTGDLGDRGPESIQALEWLKEPWFHPVEGNHEQLARDYHAGTIPAEYFARIGGAWLIGMSPQERTIYVDAINTLPTAITLETEDGPVGIVHADCPLPSWERFCAALESEPELPKDRPGQVFTASMRNICVWNRSRIESGNARPIEGVRAVVCGHTIVEHPSRLGNVIYIDTGAYRQGGRFTILDAATLQPAMQLATA
jgi:serine/threonine protein phosphatase 1